MLRSRYVFGDRATMWPISSVLHYEVHRDNTTTKATLDPRTWQDKVTPKLKGETYDVIMIDVFPYN